MLTPENGKLLVYASSLSSHTRPLRSISTAAARMAEALKLEVEVKLSRERFASVYVYYKNGDQEPIPLYRSKTEKEPNVEQVTSILRNMIYVLSFHPKQSALRQMRSEIIHFS